ncbi:complement factor H-related protein 1-like isoform X2 [Hippoglossus hippoglossus]|uniref:complement factor H-related protein 1-like isoform X2 n=1 Tax=Hippoglossus hippoglossus TaxID=8267 RepID=UPI00148D4287|nr:complement factor H-related protein 1-like isoform X2 [Hippoglossus hippoglossus]
MCSRYLGFFLLVWFPGALHAQSAALQCAAPSLDHGNFVPVKETYSHDSKLTYACRNTHKPAVEGWWAEIVCQHGTWSHTPRCIEEKACIPPTIANAKYTEASEGWYKEGHIIRITCDKGYEHKDNIATAKCINGTWSSLPMCEISIKSCRAPPKIPHAIIVDQGYQELFLEDAEVKYECEDGYSTEGSHKKTLFCLAGTWTEGPMCRSSSTSANRPLFIPIENCGTRPNVPNGVVVEEHRMYLKFQCNSFYKQVGEDTVSCYNDGSWSKLPVCEDAFCVMEPGHYDRGLDLSVTEYIKEGETKYIPCTWPDYSVAVHCSNRRITYTRCCTTYDHHRGTCS